MRQIGRYRLDEVHGSGAFATVWRGFDTELEIPVAVKVLAENWSHHADVRERFLAEARLLRRIASDRVVRVYDVGTHEGQPYFVMDFVAGGTLADLADGSLDPSSALELAERSARAVAELHAAGVVHRDIKPSNLLLDPVDDGLGRVLVADLGSAKRLAEASGITVTTGTPSYMAPEQALGRPIDERCDVYSLGVVTYVLLTGRLPFDVSDPMTLVTRTADDRPARLAEPRHLPPPLNRTSLDALLVQAMSLDPAGRPRTAADLADALAHVRAGGSSSPVVGGWRTRVVVPVAGAAFTVSAVATWLLLR
ncbi:serine/threonine-protein kinase [Aeromicrobium endophyticum]|uniref:non-specific serine/threonine protein kinase n=1 Tax=Aeromicrobium endophyticum TaxID=2292704 RepID=A0A371P2Z8_9ACTN|nr:serine/threonine-protein kinase [Aeromicrobium endophyticum]REK69910.1 serine/threonine protein kinase [Aeromicrobium endophyticum]